LPSAAVIRKFRITEGSTVVNEGELEEKATYKDYLQVRNEQERNMNMIVAELIAHLSELDPSLRVVVNGYETGFDVVNTVRVITVKPWRAEQTGAFGAWKKDEPMECDGALAQCESGELGESVVFLPRTSN
jgi:hypothetical protein